MGKVVHLLSIFHGRADSRSKTASRLPNNTRRKTDRQRRAARRKADCSDDGIYTDVGGRQSRFALCHWSNGIRSRSLLSDGQTLSFLQKSQSPTKLTYDDLSSFINSRYFYSASSCLHSLTLGISIAHLHVHYYSEVLPTTALIVLKLTHYMQLRVKNAAAKMGFKPATYQKQGTKLTTEPPRLQSSSVCCVLG